MAFLFIVENGIVKPNIETLMISPFKEIWERDDSHNKVNAIRDFTFIEFTTSMKKSNPYSGYDEITRREKVLEEVIKDKDWVEDELIIAGTEKLIEFQQEGSVTFNYFVSAKLAAEKLNKFLKELDLNAVNFKTGMPIYKPKDITSSLMDTSKVLENLATLRDKVDQELFEQVKTRGQKVISRFADPD